MITSIGKIPIIFINFTEIKNPNILFFIFYSFLIFWTSFFKTDHCAMDANERQKNSVSWIRGFRKLLFSLYFTIFHGEKKTCEINVVQWIQFPYGNWVYVIIIPVRELNLCYNNSRTGIKNPRKIALYWFLYFIDFTIFLQLSKVAYLSKKEMPSIYVRAMRLKCCI